MALKLSKKKTTAQKVVKKTIKVKKVAPRVAAVTGLLTMPTGKYTEAVGRRKVATARVRLYESDGDFIVNDKVVSQYFNTIPNVASRYTVPFELTGTKGKFSVSVKVLGSGQASQLEAMIHGISRALVKFDPGFKVLLKSSGLLSRDDRMKETRKIGTGGKARRKRQSPKR